MTKHPHTPTTEEANKMNAETAAKAGGQGATNGTQKDDGSNTVRNKNNPGKSMEFANDVEGHGDNKANTYDLVNAGNNGKTGIFHKNAKAAKMAREKSDKKEVRAIERGYYYERLIEPGETFFVPEDEVEDWFETVRSSKKGGEELV